MPAEFLKAKSPQEDIESTPGARFPFLRVDFFLPEGKAFLAELTFPPKSAHRRIRSPALKEMLCSHFDPIPPVVATGD